MNLAVIGLIALGGLLLSLASKASAATPPDATPQLPPPEPEPEADEPGAAAAPDYGQADYASAYASSPSVPAAASRAAPAPAPQLSANRPFGDQPLEVDPPEPGEAEAAAAEERAEAQASGGGGAQPTAAGKGLSFKKPATPATPALKLAAAAKAAAAPKPPAKRAPIQAARELLEYVSSVIKSGQGATLGSKTAPNPAVKAAQLDMGISPADGIYGPATRNKGKALTGKDFPARDAPPKAVTVKPAPPAVKAAAKPAPKPAAPKQAAKPVAAVVAPKPTGARNGKQAANELLSYAKAAIAQNTSLGTKAAPNSFVKAAQIDMGVSPADGVYGPATRNRGKALIGTTFPAR